MRGESEVEQLLARADLAQVTGAQADATPLLVRARKTLATAATLTGSDAYSAYILGYDAARTDRRAFLLRLGRPACTFAEHSYECRNLPSNLSRQPRGNPEEVTT
jgi:hypothetical protein